MKTKLITNNNLKRIHINRHTMTRNWKENTYREAIGVEYYEARKEAKKAYAHDVRIIRADASIIQSQKPLSCGAKCWIETNADVRTYYMGGRPEWLNKWETGKQLGQSGMAQRWSLDADWGNDDASITMAAIFVASVKVGDVRNNGDMTHDEMATAEGCKEGSPAPDD